MNDFFYKKVDAYHIAKDFVIYVYSLLEKYPQKENEVSCQLDISESLGYISAEELHEAELKAEHLSKVMSGLKHYLESKIV